eukprot:scaffold72447_cov54-Attheya_sp.AAC.3
MSRFGLAALVLASGQSSLATAFAPTSSAFIVASRNSLQQQQQESFPSIARHMADDFFDDYDEFMTGWKDNNSDRSNNSGGDRGGGGGGGGSYSDRGGGGGGGGYSDRRQGGGGGRGRVNAGGHDYERSPDDDVSVAVDVGQVDALLAERIQHKRRRDYEAADEIRDQLKSEFGVTVWDKEQTWTTNPDSGGGGARHREGGRHSRDGPDRSSRNGQRGNKREISFGPTGHDYEQTGGPIDPTICPLGEDDINALIAERLQHKLNRRFQEADELQRQLYEVNNVFVHDGQKQWRADGVRFGDSNDDSSSRGNPSRSQDSRKSRDSIRYYTFVGGNGGLSDEVIKGIADSMVKRSEAKLNGAYDLADSIRDALRDKYNVAVDDRSLQWHIRSAGYVRSQNSGALADEPNGDFSNEEGSIASSIDQKVADRLAAKLEQDFESADAIREELWEVYSVEIDDRLKEWTAISSNKNLQQDYFDDVEAPNDTSVNGAEDIVDELEEVDEAEEVVMEINSDVDEEELKSLTVPLLKERLREAGLPVSGKKAELIERLISA